MSGLLGPRIERASPSASVAPLVARLPAARVPVPSVVRSPEPVVGPDDDVGRPRSDLVRAPGARVGALGGLPGEPPNDPRAAHPRLPRLRRSPQRERSVLVTATAVAAGHDSSLANVALQHAPRSCAPPLARTAARHAAVRHSPPELSPVNPGARRFVSLNCRATHHGPGPKGDPGPWSCAAISRCGSPHRSCARACRRRRPRAAAGPG